MPLEHVVAEPAILYFGTPVVLISTLNEDHSPNLAPMSSVFWLGWRCVIGLATTSKTTENLCRTRECVMNLPSSTQADSVDRIALTTGSEPVPPSKLARGYRSERRKFELARLTPMSSDLVAPRALECPVQLEATVEHWRGLGEGDERIRGRSVIFELRVRRVHLARSILLPGHENRVDPVRWRPLIMSFQRFYGLAGDEAHTSRLASVPEALYQTADVPKPAGQVLSSGSQ
jgi:flavin reductase (DIM6/NTAB) family NADH-FMN oxidoreductase RutF